MIDVLIVEDFDATAEALTRFLKIYKYEAEHVDTIAVAKNKLFFGKPSACIVDLRLPDGSGEDFIGFIRAVYPEIQVIAWSGFFNQEVVGRLRQKGVRHFIEKPFVGPVESILEILPPPRQTKTPGSEESGVTFAPG